MLLGFGAGLVGLRAGAVEGGLAGVEFSFVGFKALSLGVELALMLGELSLLLIDEGGAFAEFSGRGAEGGALGFEFLPGGVDLLAEGVEFKAVLLAFGLDVFLTVLEFLAGAIQGHPLLLESSLGLFSGAASAVEGGFKFFELALPAGKFGVGVGDLAFAVFQGLLAIVEFARTGAGFLKRLLQLALRFLD
ncbi:MAG: hypothetical protein EDS66_08475 [Planctomycetota bacterium]|nr:MAG: hypothetical protein EDS66_08475 [Planctomycetota bacterium]MCQ3921735.1 hypothetical protein [Planctomycetota bacterium]